MHSHNYTETRSHSFDFRPQAIGVDASWPPDCQAWARAIAEAGLSQHADDDGEVWIRVDFEVEEHVGWGACVERTDYEVVRAWCYPPNGPRFQLASWQRELLEEACSEHWASEMVHGDRGFGPFPGLRVAFEGV